MSVEDMKTMPHVLKPFTLLLSLLVLIFVAICPYRAFIWYAIFVAVLQLIVTAAVFGLHAVDTVVFVHAPQWPIIELAYSAVFVVTNLISLVILFGGLFYFFDLLIIISLALCTLQALSFGLNGLLIFKSRQNASSSSTTNQATAAPPSAFAGINPGV